MSKEIKNMSVSFNLSDPFQKQMKEYVEQYPNFSGYIKRLIQRDMEGGNAVRGIKKGNVQIIPGGITAQINGSVTKL